MGEPKTAEEALAKPIGNAVGFHDFDLIDETGKTIGSLNLSEQKDGKQIYVEMIQAGKDKRMYDPNFLGPAVIRDLRRQIKAEFPNAETITGHRVSGAREKAGTYEAKHAMPVIKLSQEAPEGWGHVDAGPTLRDLFQEVGGHTIDSSHYELHYNPELEPHRAALDKAVRDVLARIAPKQAHVFTPDLISLPGTTNTGIKGFAQQFKDQNPWIVVAIDSNKAIGVARHEAIHHLRQQGRVLDRRPVEPDTVRPVQRLRHL